MQITNNLNTHSNKYKLLVFDWDGTLIDSIEQIVSSLQIASHTVCGETVTEDAARGVIGLGLTEAIEKLHPELDSTTIEQVAAAYKQHYLYENPIQAQLFDGVTNMLDELTANGYQLAISTGKSRIGLDRALQEHSLEDYFASTQCAGENRSKPHPEMLLGILHELNIPRTQALMIGDSEHDLMMANNALVDSVAVSHGVQEADVLMVHQPLICLDRITDLSHFLSHNM
jgi:phosphoglycolate phosphatase